MGDILARPALLLALGQLSSTSILDAGCGTGYMASLLAAQGAKATACDRSWEMVQAGLRRKREGKENVSYLLADLCATPFGSSTFDAVVAAGVLIHFSLQEMERFLREMHRILRPDGRLLVSTVHPTLFTRESPARTPGSCWLKLVPMESERRGRSRRFRESYYDVDGREFSSTIWQHSIQNIQKSFGLSYFYVETLNELSVQKKHLVSKAWGEQFGYPAYLQIVGKKH